MIDATWTRGQDGPDSRVEAGLSVLTSAFLVSPIAFCLLFALPDLAEAALGPDASSFWIPLAALIALTPALGRWTLRNLFELWGTRWTFVSHDGTRWGTVQTLFGWYGAGKGVCLTGFQPTEAGRTPLSSADALGAGTWAVASCLSRLRAGRSQRAIGSFEALMLAAIVGLTSRGSATISRARELRWQKDWLARPRRSAAEQAFTIERTREMEDGGEVERRILNALQVAEERLATPLQEPPPSYRVPAPPRRTVRLRLDGELLGPAFATAFASLGTPAVGGAPVAVAAAIDDFGLRDPERMAYLCGLLAAHRAR